MEAYEGNGEFDEEDASAASQIDITADSGVYLAVVAGLLLALSTFLMHTNMSRNQSYLSIQQMGPPPPGSNPTVTVHPG
jgi:hypothetical protein